MNESPVEAKKESGAVANRYKPNGIPLNDYEREVLVILMEECAEVTQAASKLLRFGKENRPDTGISNSVVLAHEIGDLRATVALVTGAGLCKMSDVQDGVDRKNARLARFMQTTAMTAPPNDAGDPS